MPLPGAKDPRALTTPDVPSMIGDHEGASQDGQIHSSGIDLVVHLGLLGNHRFACTCRSKALLHDRRAPGASLCGAVAAARWRRAFAMLCNDLDGA